MNLLEQIKEVCDRYYYDPCPNICPFNHDNHCYFTEIATPYDWDLDEIVKILKSVMEAEK